jgi:hypothetical protein
MLRSLASALSGALVLALALGAAPAGAAATVSWSSPQAIPSGGEPTAVACPSESVCVAINHAGDAFATTDPMAPVPSWSVAPVEAGEAPLNAVSCAPGGPCAAVDGHGNVFVSSAPGSSSWSRTPLKGAPVLTGVSCASASLCVAVDEAGDVWTSTSPGSGTWTATELGEGHKWKAVSCASATVCVAVDAEGEVSSSSNPSGGEGDWHTQAVAGDLLAVSCSSAALCVAVNATGGALASGDPAATTPSWTLTPIDGGERMTGVSCTSLGLCVAVDGAGRALASANAGAAVPSWSQPAGIDPHVLAGVSCLADGFCMALDAAGGSLSGRVPAPAVTTLAPMQVTSASAILAGVVETNDAILTACTFEVGPGGVGGAFSHSIPCSAAPGSINGSEDVSAPLAGLAPNTIYHYRLAAVNATGATVGAEVAFTTAVSSQVALVVPHPSITGTPAVGQHLTCHAGTPTGAAARLTYAWVRDLIPIPNTGASTYTAKGQDSGHHLQCQVTATDGGGSATARSAFVTIPAGGAPVSAGETSVGRATFRGGRVSVPIFCSPHASGGCHVGVRLAVIETLRGGRVVAVAARAHGASSALRHVTVTLASSRAHVAPGARTTVSTSVGSTARRLLAADRRFTAYLYVRGTVIGVIESQLARELVTLSASSAHVAIHADRQR